MKGRSAADRPADPVDRARWESILDEVGTRALIRYTMSYLELLPERLDDLEHAAAVGAAPQALRIMADLRTSSAMLGAGRLAALVTRAETELRTSGTQWQQTTMRALRAEAGAVDAALRAALAELTSAKDFRAGQPRSDPPAPPNR